MSEFMDTVDLERALLRLVSKSKIYANLYMHRAKPEFFTSEPRKFIFGVALRTHTDTNSHLTKQLVDFDIKHKIDPGEQAIYEGEWNIIEGLSPQETPDSIIDKLMEAVTGRAVMDAAEELADLLEAGDIVKAVETLKQAGMSISTVKDDQPIRKLTDFEHRKQHIKDKQEHPEKYAGLKTGIFPTFDKKTGGFFGGELTLIAGVTGLGKSTLLKAIEWGLIMTNPNVNVLHIANEEYSLQVENKFDSLVTGIDYLDFKLGKISDEDLQKWEDRMTELKTTAGFKYGQIYTKEVPAFTDVTLVEQAYRELESEGIKIDIIVIDHLPHIVPIMKAYGENDERWKAAGDCKELARSLHVPVVTAGQAATEVEEKQNKGRRAGKLDVYGSKGQIHVSNNFIIITYRGRDNSQEERVEYERDVYWLADCKKNRDGAPFSFLAKHHVYTGKVEEIKEDDDGKTTGDDHTADADQKAEADDILNEKGQVEESTPEATESAPEPEAAPKTDEPPKAPVVPEETPDIVPEPPPKKPMSLKEKMRARKEKSLGKS